MLNNANTKLLESIRLAIGGLDMDMVTLIRAETAAVKFATDSSAKGEAEACIACLKEIRRDISAQHLKLSTIE